MKVGYSNTVADVYKEVSSKIATKEQKGESLSAKEISAKYLIAYQEESFLQSKETLGEQADTFQLADIGYNGKAIQDLSQEEAKVLVSDGGFFSVASTSERIADFVLGGAGDDIEKLKAGKEGVLRGFEEAEKLWGEKLPQISYDTINKTVEMIDARLSELGANIVDTNA